MNEMLQDMASKVKDFKVKMGVPMDSQSGLLSDERFGQIYDHIREELNEMAEAYRRKDPLEVADALVDIVYLAIGALLESGVPPNYSFDEVHRANMQKKQGNSKRNGQFEAVKPEGWKPPDHGPLLEKMNILNNVSPVYVELTKLRIERGSKYNQGTVRREDHFPLGHHSYFQMVWIKAIRVRSLVESLSTAKDINEQAETNRLIRRELADLIPYSCFWMEWMDGGKDLER